METEKEKFNQMVAKYQADLQNLQVRELHRSDVVLDNIRSVDPSRLIYKVPG